MLLLGEQVGWEHDFFSVLHNDIAIETKDVLLLFGLEQNHGITKVVFV